MTNETVKVRYAPSPTGFLHVGNARTAIFNYLFARSTGGKLVLRIEDTDTARSTKDSENDIIESLKMLGIEWDEGIGKEGEFGPYRQSERTEIYKQAVNKLLASGSAYRCFCSTARLEKLRHESESAKRPFMYDQNCRSISSSESEKRAQSESFVVRLKVPEEAVSVDDIIKGRVIFKPGVIDDFVISRGYDQPLFHLAVVVDDAMMQVTHVIRGEDHLSNTPKHIFLQRALNFQTPIYAHLPLLLDESRKKLSKRSGNVNLFVSTLIKEQGFLAEALFNGLALLGWNPKTSQEIFSKEDLINEFKLENVQKAGAVFSLNKLTWLNKQYVKDMPLPQLLKIALEYFSFNKISPDEVFLSRLLEVEKGRLSLLNELPTLYEELKNDPALDPKLIPWRESNNEDTSIVLQHFIGKIEELSDNSWSEKNKLREIFLTVADESGKGRATVLWPVRYSLSGKEKSAGPDELAWLLGKDETIKRLKRAIIEL